MTNFLSVHGDFLQGYRLCVLVNSTPFPSISFPSSNCSYLEGWLPSVPRTLFLGSECHSISSQGSVWHSVMSVCIRWACGLELLYNAIHPSEQKQQPSVAAQLYLLARIIGTGIQTTHIPLEKLGVRRVLESSPAVPATPSSLSYTAWDE